jgi:cytochrome P450
MLVAEGADWRRRRQAAMLAFTRERLRGYAATIVEQSDRELARWPSYGCVNISRRMMNLSLSIISNTALALPQDVDADRLLDSLDTLMFRARGLVGTGLRFPPAIPTPGNIHARLALKHLDEAVFSNAPREEAFGQLTREDLITMLLVGFETTALAMGYACWLLAIHEDVQEEVREQLVEAMSEGPAEPTKLARVPLLRAVILETLRLYPPVWAMGREVINRTSIGGFELQSGAQILIPMYVNQRRSDWYISPDSFRPERWLNSETEHLPAFALSPFGDGARRCFGERLAYQEMEITLANLLSRFRMESVSSPPCLAPSVTLRTRRPIELLVERL